MAVAITSQELNKFLGDNRGKTISYLRNRYTALSNNQLEDVYQDSSIALWENLSAGKVAELTSSLYTYFLRICINQVLKVLSKKGNVVRLDDVYGLKQDDEYDDDKINEVLDFIEEEDDNNGSSAFRAENLVKAIMEELKEKCRDLLWGFHGDGLSWTTLADMFGIKNADTAKQEASRCRKKFKEKYLELIEKYNN